MMEQPDLIYRDLYDSAPKAYFIIGSDGTIRNCNQKACELLGYANEQSLAGRVFYETCVPDPSTRRAAENAMSAVLAGEEIEGIEMQLLKSDATRIWARLSMNSSHSSGGQAREVRVIIADIDEQKRVQLAMANREHRYRTLFNQSKQAIMLFDPVSTRPVEFNDAAPAFFGYGRDEFHEVSIFDFETTESRLETKAHIEAVMETGGDMFETQVRRKDGNTIDVLVNVQPIEIGDTRLLHAIMTDITGLKHSHEKLSQSNNLLEGINHILHKYLTCESDEDLARMCLDVCERSTGSKFGFIGEINKDGLVDTIAISDQGWAECRVAADEAPRQLHGMHISGYLFQAIQDQQTVIVNDPESNARKRGTPAGHVPVSSFMGVPLMSDGAVIGMIGLANKAGGYTESDRESADGLAVAISEAILRKRAEERIHTAEMEWHQTFDSISDLVSVHDRDFRLVRVNKAFAEHFHMTPEELQGKRCYEVVHGTSTPWPDCPHLKTMETGECVSLEVNDPNVGIPMLVSTSPIFDKDGNVTGSVHISKDISLLKHSEEELEKQRDVLRARTDELSTLYNVSRLVSSSIEIEQMIRNAIDAVLSLELFESLHQGGVLLIDGNRMKLIYDSNSDNDEFLRQHENMSINDCLCGMAARTGKIVVSHDSDADIRHSIRYPGMSPHGHVILPLITRNEVIGVMYLYTTVDVEVSEKSIRMLAMISEQLAVSLTNAIMYERARDVSLHDPLTGLANRNLMKQGLDICAARAKRKNELFSLVMCDLDHFKKYNDTYGHTAGDKLLVDLARLLENEVREIDTLVRFGGEEFLIILPDTDLRYAVDVAERIRSRVEISDFYHDDEQPPAKITLSLGCACWNADLSGIDELLTITDNALYDAKSRGRNQVCSSIPTEQ